MVGVRELAESRELFINLTLRELRGKYKRSLLGWSWSLVNPLASMIIFSIVFLYFLKVPVPIGDPSGMKVFAFFLLCGLLPWNLLANGMTGSMGTLLANSNLIKKVYFRREVLVASNLAAAVISLLIELAVLAVALLVGGNVVFGFIPIVMLVLALQALFVLGIGLALSVLNVYFRDIQHFTGIILQIWFYATPIVYPVSVVPAKGHLLGFEIPVRFLYGLNPMTRFVEVYRDMLYDVRMPPLLDMAYLTVVSLSAMALGLVVFSRLEPKLAEEL